MEAAEEFGAFFERVFDPLVGALWLYCGDRWVAEEIAQEALARVARDWPKVAQMAAPMGWAHRVAFNLAHSHFRRARIGRRVTARHARQERPEAVATEVIPEALVVREAVRALPPRQRQAVVLFYFADMPVAEVARVMGAAENTVKSWLSRGRRALQVELGPLAHEEDVDVH